MKKQFHIPIALAVFFLTFFCNAIAQNVDFRKESDLEKDIDNLISMKSNFSKIETTELNNYGNIEEFGTSIKPHNYSDNLSILKNKKSKTSAFVYANVETIEASYFAISINAFLINPNTKWKSEYDKGSPKFYSNATILYDHKESGYMVNYDRENKEHKTWLFIGNLAKDDIEKYLAEKYKISAIDNFLKEMNDFFPDSTISYLKNVFKDSTEKRENEKKSAILEFMSQFDSIELKKWAMVDKIKENLPQHLKQPEVLDIIYEFIDLAEGRTNGFKYLKLKENNSSSKEILYNAKSNSLMHCNAEYVCERNNKTCYNAYYYGDRERNISLQAFLGILEVYKTDAPLTIQKTETGNKTKYDLYLDKSNIASYIINDGETPNSVLYIYEPGY